ncbi:auxin-responsive protein SAUR68-like [Rosa rugosa]|uniref:auxin-responsive protein SAUR68-like n=1 Tax=Rosa rugosa TaxID=74645 RepID=UPI002B401BCF|nr:auxin-responsive protein SAUR68-like [Rosa rugosa]
MDVMLSPKKLIKMTKKLQKVPVIGRKRTSHPTVIGSNKMNSTTADKGTFVIYTLDKRRFMLPLSYLCNHIFQELFKMSEEELGISRSGPIIVCQVKSFATDYLLVFYAALETGAMGTDIGWVAAWWLMKKTVAYAHH